MTPSVVWLWCSVASAAEPKLELGGNLKLFHVSSYPFDNDLFAAEVADGTAFLRDYPLAEDTVRTQATSAGLLTSRFTADLDVGALTLSVHPQLTVQPGSSGASGLSVAQTGLGIPEAVDLSWEVVDDDGVVVQLRADRLSARVDVGPARFTAGRQAITFGHGLFFTPLDLVNPFFPTAVDQEYKPGVDAVRADAFFGMGGQVTVVSAYRGDWATDGLVHAVHAQQTVGVWDVGLFGALVQGDGVGGLTAAGSVGPVSLHADATVTAPAMLLDDNSESSTGDPYVRAVVGAQASVTPRTQVAGEVYVQTQGATDPSAYLEQAAGPRYARGELWLMGRTYAGLSVSQELAPMLSGSVFSLVNLEDPSALVGPGLAWNVADNVSANVGAYVGLGARPTDYQVEDHPDGAAALAALAEASRDPVQSEFGLLPTTVFASLQAWY